MERPGRAARASRRSTRTAPAIGRGHLTADPQAGPLVGARRAPARVHEHPGRQRGDLRLRHGQRRPDPRHLRSRARPRSRVVARRDASRSSRASRRQPGALRRARRRRRPTRLTSDPRTTASPRGPRPARSRSPAIAAGDFDLYSMAEDGSGVRRLTQEPGWTPIRPGPPAGDRLAYVHGAARRRPGLYVRVATRTGPNARPLAGTGAVEHSPAWSPDGTRIAYAVEGGGSQVSVSAADGRGIPGRASASGRTRLGAVPAPVGAPDVGENVTVAPLAGQVLVAPATTEAPSTDPAIQAQLRTANEVPVGSTSTRRRARWRSRR